MGALFFSFLPFFFLFFVSPFKERGWGKKNHPHTQLNLTNFKNADGTTLVHRAKESFPLQFGREVIARFILEQPSLASWQGCVVPLAKETKFAEDFKALFKPHDPSL